MNKDRIFGAGLVVFFLFLLAGVAPLSAAEIIPETTIQNIVVYPDRAMIQRAGTAAIKKGENVLRITGITPYLIDESVEAIASGGKISEVKVEKTFLVKTHQEKIKALEDKLENVNGRIRNHANEAAVIQNSIDFFKKLNPFPEKQKITSAEIEAHLKFVEKSLGDDLKELTGIEEKIRKLTEEKKNLEQELKNLRSFREESKNILVTLFADRDSAINLVCSYVVRGAGWQPLYDVRADSRGARIELSAFATLRQSTGEDWKDVKIEISTAKPAVRGIPPEISGWYVDEYKPRPALQRSFAAPAPAGIAKEKMEEERAAGKDAAPMPEMKTEATAFSFVLPGKADVPADGQPHKVLLASATKDVNLNYYAVPKLSGYAYLQTDLKNPFAFPILGGRINIYIDGKFVSTASFPKTILSEENMNLSLGVDEAIKVESKLLKRFTEQVGTFSRETREKFEYLIEVTNGKEKEIAIEVKDRHPVSRNEKIKVEIKAPGKGEAKIGEDGIISWSLKLSPREKKQLKNSFSVTYPRDLRITGLE